MALRSIFRSSPLQKYPGAWMSPASSSYLEGKAKQTCSKSFWTCSRTDRKVGTQLSLWNPFSRRILSPYSSTNIRWWCSKSPSSLPWSEILPFRSVRVNLTKAVHREGWTLERVEDFPQLLQCKSGKRWVCGGTHMQLC